MKTKRIFSRLFFSLVLFSGFTVTTVAQHGQSKWNIKRKELNFSAEKPLVIKREIIKKPYQGIFYTFTAKAGQKLTIYLRTNKKNQATKTEIVFLGLPQTPFQYGKNGRLSLIIPADYNNYEIGILNYQKNLNYRLSVSLK